MTQRWIKHLSQGAMFHKMAVKLGTAYLRGMRYVSKIAIHGENIPLSFLNNQKPFILCFWHEYLLMAVHVWRYQSPMSVLISSHGTGRLIAETVRAFGVQNIQGSHRKKGDVAFRRMLNVLQKGECVGITPDGPQGPRHCVHRGVIALSRLSKCPIVPLAYASNACYRLSRWDSLMVPFPFGHHVLAWGEPIAPFSRDVCESDAQNMVIGAMSQTHQMAQSFL